MEGWPLVGRSKGLAQLTGGLVAQQGAVITGPAGVGRTTLAMTDAAGTHLSREEWRRVAKAFVKERARR